jgi:hypothetical protein
MAIINNSTYSTYALAGIAALIFLEKLRSMHSQRNHDFEVSLQEGVRISCENDSYGWDLSKFPTNFSADNLIFFKLRI